MKQFVFTCAMVLGLALTASAQPITSYRLAIYMQGAASPMTTFDFAAANVTCGPLLPDQTGTVANPTRATFRHPAFPNQECTWADPGTGPLFALPFSPTATYQATLRVINSAGMSAESPRSNLFTRPGTVLAAPALFIRSDS